MKTIAIPDFNKKLRTSRPYLIKRQIKRPPPGVLGDVQIIPEIIIPPINTEINFSEFLPSIKPNQYSRLNDINLKNIPQNFNWRENGPLNIRKQITTPPNQHSCGSCWAVSSATVISDNFVVSKKIENPKLSATWILACYGQNQCGGGNPSVLMSTLGQNNGITTQHCLDYSWCTQNPACNPPPGSQSVGEDSGQLSGTIPQCACFKKGDWLLFYIKNNSVIIPHPDGDGKITPSEMIIVKHHIMNVGPLVSGFVVYDNFRSGKFTKLQETEGVYLEDGIYDKDSFSFGYSNNIKILGSHAISVIGWGRTKNPIPVKMNTDGSFVKEYVNYWYCRNSWSEKWGDGGYFKFAMYPHNKTSLIGNQVNIASGGVTRPSGGLILIEPSRYEKVDNLPYLNAIFSKGKLNQPLSFYNRDKGVIKLLNSSPSPSPSPSPSTSPSSSPGSIKPKGLSGGAIAGIVIGVILLLFFIVIIFYYVLTKNLINYAKKK